MLKLAPLTTPSRPLLKRLLPLSLLLCFGALACGEEGCGSDSTDDPEVEVCDNFFDDDGDGQVDCADDTCASSPSCQTEVCDDTLDNDGDGEVDCDDGDCILDPACVDETPDEVCDDEVDNDQDGQTDCQDSDCASAPACQTDAEVCDDTLDNDADGLIDCEDEDCAGAMTCSDCPADADGAPLDCQDARCTEVDLCVCAAAPLRDDVLHGQVVDCNVPACRAVDPSCQTGLDVELCAGDRRDNDADGLIDCDDPDCFGVGACPTPECIARTTNLYGEIVPDCADPACAASAPGCQSSPVELCEGDTFDNDNDGAIDCDDSDCASSDYCACPLDAVSGLALDCLDPRCATNAQCVCDSASPVDAGVWGRVPDCSVPECVQTYPGCQQGLPDELCDGFGVDNDDNGQADCQDSSCSSLSQCACPAPNDEAACSSQAALCGDTPFCLCLAAQVPNAAGDLVADCQLPACQAIDASCQQGGVELCLGDGVDNDNDGFIDCQDVDCSGTPLCGDLSCATTRVNGVDVPDCSSVLCQQTEAACQLGGGVEICFGGVDNDGDTLIDCQDSDCDADAFCACPRDAQGAPLDCSDARCVSEDTCVCQASLLDDADFGMIADCTLAACQNADPSCQTGLGMELCLGDGVDNDNDGDIDCADTDCAATPNGVCVCPLDAQGDALCSDPRCAQDPNCLAPPMPEVCNSGMDEDRDGLIDCQDPDCQDFSDLTNACTQELCGDPALNNQIVVHSNTAPLEITSVSQWSAEFPSMDGAPTVKYGSLSLSSSGAPYSLPSSRLRCVLPDPSVPMSGEAPLIVDISALSDSSGLGTIRVVDTLEWLALEGSSGLPGLSGLQHVLKTLRIREPVYTSVPAAPITFAGLGQLRTIGGDIEVVPTLQNLSAGTTSTPRALGTEIRFEGLGNLTYIGGNLLTTYNLSYDTSVSPAREELDLSERGCEAIFEDTAPSRVRGNFSLIGSFSSLTSLRYIGGDVCIASRQGLMDFDGLNALEEIGGDLLLGELEEFPFDYVTTEVKFTNLSSLRRIGGSFGSESTVVGAGEPLFYLSDDYIGLGALRVIGEHLITIAESPTMGGSGFVEYRGLEGLTRIGGNLELVAGDQGVSAITARPFESLTSLSEIEGWLIVRNTPISAIGAMGLPALTTLGGLYLKDNLQLVGIPALAGLTTLSNGGLWIQDNDALTSIAALSSLRSIAGDVNIDDESLFPSLSDLEIVEGNLHLVDLPTITSIGQYFTSLTSLGGVIVRDTPTLTSLNGFPASATAGTTLNGDIVLSGANVGSSLDKSALAGYQTVLGSVRLEDGHNDLSFLSSVQQIEGRLYIANNAALTNVSGLGAITDLGSLFVYQNAALSSLSGLSSLARVDGDVDIDDNLMLSDVALPSLTTVGGQLRLSESSVSSLSGWSALTSVGGSLILRTSASLTSLNGLQNLTTIGKSLVLTGLTGLTDISALSSLTQVNGVELVNSALTSLNGLQQIPSTLPGGLQINQNTQLSDATQLSHITLVGNSLGFVNNDLITALPFTSLQQLSNALSLSIRENAALTDISVLLSLQVLDDPFINVSITFNPALCLSSVTAVKNHLLSLGHQGLFDQNNNNGGC